MTEALETLGCDACGAPVPLADQPSVACARCGTAVAVPAAHRDASAVAAVAAVLRRRVEPHWARLSRAPARSWQWAAAATLLLLPIGCSTTTALVAPAPLSPGAVVLGAALPALVPGAAWWVWVLSTEISASRLGDAMAASAPGRAGDPPGCRRCGAPLHLEPDALAATCGYCGADSLVGAPVLGRVAAALAARVSTLAEAVAVLRRRRWFVAFGVCSLGALLALAWLAIGAVLLATGGS